MRRSTIALLGAGVGWAAICILLGPPPAPARAAPGWAPLDPQRLTLRKGVRYRGDASVPIFSPSTSTVRSRVESEGFVDVVVSTSRPADWPMATAEDYYVEATWARPDEVRSVPSVVKHAWGAT